jgi:hypothetical protein
MRGCASRLLQVQGKRRDLVTDIATYREQRIGQGPERLRCAQENRQASAFRLRIVSLARTRNRPRPGLWTWAPVVFLLAFAVPAGAQVSTQSLSLIPLSNGDETSDPVQAPVFTPASGPTDWTKVIGNSLRLASLEHVTRLMLQPETRRELSGPFLADYRRSVRRPQGWNDGNPWTVNYIGHSIHGAAAGFVWIDAQRNPKNAPGYSREFWLSHGQAALWAAAYSLQFEMGPFSEASIGNVGMHPGTTGWVDHVVTPLGGLVFMVLEDWIDRKVILAIERKTGNVFVRMVARVAFNPSRSMSAMAQGQMPWTRADRRLR